MEKKNKVFIATSLDGFIAGKNGELDFLESIPELNHIDTGYTNFTQHIPFHDVIKSLRMPYILLLSIK